MFEIDERYNARFRRESDRLPTPSPSQDGNRSFSNSKSKFKMYLSYHH